MIDYKELSVGDWVINTEFDKQVTDRVGCVEKNRVFLEHAKLYTPINFIEPISLTPEILKKNGFECRDDLVKSFGDPETFIWENDECDLAMVEWLDSYNDGESRWGEYWLMDINGVNGKISIRNNILYVHELQHALRLCGIEKEIEL